MTDRNEMNESNELDEQELEQAAGGVDLAKFSRHLKEKMDSIMTVLYRCPKCGATKKVQGPGGTFAPLCHNCIVKMVKE